MTKHHAIEDTIGRARHYGAIATDALALVPPSAIKQALEETVAFCIARAERRLEFLIPVHQVGEQGQIAGVERVQSRPKDVGDLAFVDECGQLDSRTVSCPPFWISMSCIGIAIGEDSVVRSHSTG